MQQNNAITPNAVRAARGLLDWTIRDLSENARVSTTSILNFERGAQTMRIHNQEAIRRTFEDAGIQFSEGDGVRFAMKGTDSDAPQS